MGKNMQEPEYYWHVHHEVLCEALTGPLQNRIDYIMKYKAPSEVDTRLRLLTPVLHSQSLPAQWKEAYAKRKEAYAKRKEADAKRKEADAKRKEAYAKWNEAYAKWKEADAKWRPQIEALHKKEHLDCPWNGKTIFP